MPEHKRPSKTKFPNKEQPCYDCGSTIPNHHTPLCGMVGDRAVRDLPQTPGTQWWTKGLMAKRHGN